MLQKRMTAIVSIGLFRETSQHECTVHSNAMCYHSPCGTQSLWKITLISSNTKELPSCCNYAEDSLKIEHIQVQTEREKNVEI